MSFGMENFKIKLVVHHAKSVRTARQYFHDLNALRVVVSVNLAAAMDFNDPINEIVATLETTIPALHNRVERESRRSPKRCTTSGPESEPCPSCSPPRVKCAVRVVPRIRLGFDSAEQLPNIV